MGTNRLDDVFRDPTLERPATDYYRVRIEPHGYLSVTRDTAARILAALIDENAPTLIRCETIGGSVAWVRADAVLYVQESTRAQRDAERRFWKEIDDEDEAQSW